VEPATGKARGRPYVLSRQRGSLELLSVGVRSSVTRGVKARRKLVGSFIRLFVVPRKAAAVAETAAIIYMDVVFLINLYNLSIFDNLFYVDDVVAADQRHASVTSERPTTTTGVVDGSRDSPSPPSSLTASPPPPGRPPPPRRCSSPTPQHPHAASSSDHQRVTAAVNRPHSAADLDLLPGRQNGAAHHVTSGHVTTPDVKSKLHDRG